MLEFLILAGLTVWTVLAIRGVKKNGCGGDCSRCPGGCRK